MAFTLEDILQEFAEASQQGEGEFLDGFRRFRRSVRPIRPTIRHSEWLRRWRIKGKRWRDAHRESERERKRRYYEADRTRASRWRLANREKWNAYFLPYLKQWRAANRDKVQAYEQKRHQRRRQNPAYITKRRQWQRQNYQRIKADPVRAEHKRQLDREAQRRSRARRAKKPETPIHGVPTVRHDDERDGDRAADTYVQPMQPNRFCDNSTVDGRGPGDDGARVRT